MAKYSTLIWHIWHKMVVKCRQIGFPWGAPFKLHQFVVNRQETNVPCQN